MISLPAGAAASIVGALVMAYGSRMRWNRVSLLLSCGVMGWAIGGAAAVIDSTVAVNAGFDNTFWPRHFHTYYLMGVVLMILGFASHLGQESGQLAERMELTKLTVGLLVLGGYGFLLMLFYYGGVHSLPRYPSAPQEVAHGASQARLALVFISALLVGVVLSLWDTGRRYWRSFSLSS